VIGRLLKWLLGGLPPPEQYPHPEVRTGAMSVNEQRFREGYQPRSGPIGDPPPPRTVITDRPATRLMDRSPPQPVKWTPRHGQVCDCALYEDGQGWLNVYETDNGRVHMGGVYRTPSRADAVCKSHRMQRIFVRWEV
jgi:hypothetical protein